MRECLVVVAVTWCLLMTSVGGIRPRDGFHAKRLYDDKLKKSAYSRLIRPVGNDSDSLPVRVGLRLTSIIDVVRTAGFFLGSLVHAVASPDHRGTGVKFGYEQLSTLLSPLGR